MLALAGAGRLFGPSAPTPPPSPAPLVTTVTDAHMIDLREEHPVEGDGWQLIDRLSAHYILVLKVETERIDEALAIARELVEPVRATYAEVIVYFYRPRTDRVLASRRVQWTPRGGYVETDYEP